MDREILRGMNIVIGDRDDETVMICQELGMNTVEIGKYPDKRLREEIERSGTDFLLMHVSDNLAVVGLILALSPELQKKVIVRKRIEGAVKEGMMSAYRQLEAAGIYTTDNKTLYPGSLEENITAISTLLLDFLSLNESGQN